ncbi:hypothetical protein [Gordonia sp. CNJ-863]|uniref:DUF6414 family protein n=1 Tax=Gordonia sp. CNJ-863 TaxID=1904963 RepID=UPI000A456ECE|nr:hypothetical protein [Gordonia sp. CNJ-863]
MTHPPETAPGPQPDGGSRTAAIVAPVVVYQNPDFVSGLLQAILGAGLLESAETEDQQNYSQSQNQGNTTGANASGKAGFLGFGSADAGANLQRVREAVQADQTNRAQRLKYVFSQAYYLNYLRYLLSENNIITPVDTLESAHDLKPGDIVEFSSTFRANEINAVLDIATPELVSTVTKYVMLRTTNRELRDINDVDGIIRHRQVGELNAADSAELAAAVATALRQDFRSEHTREFYGLIATGVEGSGIDESDDTDSSEADVPEGEDRGLTAVTVCETAHFTTADPDRLLDGQFTVLGKVVSPLQQDVGVLERNKLLDRIDPDLVATVFDNLAVLSQQAPAQSLTEGFDGSGIDLEFSAYVPGSSFAVLPIAIYA